MPICPICRGKLLQITDGVDHGVRCLIPTCLFNFQDQSCPKCGEPPVNAERPDLGTYRCECGGGHSWILHAEGVWHPD